MQQQIKVWDPLVRIFHWGTAAAFAVAYLTEDDWLSLHTLAGYLVLAAVITRVLWGFIGTRHARFTDFVRGPSSVLGYVRDILHGHPKRHLGHNPAGGAMVVALLILMVLTSLSGLALYGGAELAGPLRELMAGAPPFWLEALEEGHELLANLTLLLVLLHVGGVILASLQHRENLVLAMFTGIKTRGSE